MRLMGTNRTIQGGWLWIGAMFGESFGESPDALQFGRKSPAGPLRNARALSCTMLCALRVARCALCVVRCALRVSLKTLRRCVAWLPSRAAQRSISSSAGKLCSSAPCGSTWRSVALHCLVLNGVYRLSTDGEPVFVEVPAPTDEALQAVLHKIITRMTQAAHAARHAGRRAGFDLHG